MPFTIGSHICWHCTSASCWLAGAEAVVWIIRHTVNSKQWWACLFISVCEAMSLICDTKTVQNVSALCRGDMRVLNPLRWPRNWKIRNNKIKTNIVEKKRSIVMLLVLICWRDGRLSERALRSPRNGRRWSSLHLGHHLLQVWRTGTVRARHLALLRVSRCTDAFLGRLPLSSHTWSAPLRRSVFAVHQLIICRPSQIRDIFAIIWHYFDSTPIPSLYVQVCFRCQQRIFFS